MKKIILQVPTDVAERVSQVFVGSSIEDVALRALKKVLGEAELQIFAAKKRAEVEAEAKRINQEFGLGDVLGK